MEELSHELQVLIPEPEVVYQLLLSFCLLQWDEWCPPHKKTHLSGICECELIWNMSLCRSKYIKDLKIRSSWIIQIAPTSSDNCLYMRQKKGRCGHSRRKGHVKTEIGVMQPRPQIA